MLPAEIDYLVALGELPELARMAREGRVFSYARKAEPPASFWTAVATGVPGPDHGVSALDSFRPLGVRTPLARSGPLRAWWSRVEVPLGLAEYRAVLANRRRAFTVWELASRGGEPALAVNWWATYPAEPIPGLVVAHGAYQLLREGAEGAVAPAEERPALAGGRRRSRPDRRTPGWRRPSLRRAAASVLDRALLPDRFYRDVFARRMAGGAARRGALPAGARHRRGRLARRRRGAGRSRALRSSRRTDGMLAGAFGGVGTVAIVLDPGRRREGGEGRVILWRRGRVRGSGGGGRGERAAVRPEAVAAALLRALGLPQSEELPAPPAGCAWAPPPVVVAGYGAPRRDAPARLEGAEYLASLRALGYL